MYCAGCEKSFIQTELKRCGACNVAHYCGIECQRADWPIHKRHCKDLKKFLEKETANEEHHDYESKLEIKEMRAWMADGSWPTEPEALNWIRKQLQANLVVFSRGNLSSGSVNSEMKKYDHYLASEIFYGLMSPGPIPPATHLSNVRRVDWVLHERFGLEGMQWYFAVFMNMIAANFAFPKLTGVFYTMENVSQINFKGQLERIWDDVGDWKW